MKVYENVIPGMEYGKLTVICRDQVAEDNYLLKNKNRRRFWRCECKCGNEATVLETCLKNGHTTSCGCNKKFIRHKQDDLTGKSFGDLVVLRIDESRPPTAGVHTYWICKCNACGNERSIRGSDLRLGKSTDCGCKHYMRISDSMVNNYIGQKIGHLTVISRDLSCGYQAGVHARWICRCDLCGKEEGISSASLNRDGKDRCKKCEGYTLGETKIMEILDSNNIPYIHNKPYSDCIFPDTNALLRFDFRIIANSECDYLIEFDGRQHVANAEWDKKDPKHGLEYRQQRDAFKNNWCRQHNKPLIRIPYSHLNSICIDDLQLNTTKYLVS